MFVRRFPGRPVLLSLAAAFLFGLPTRARAQGNLRLELNEVAKGIKQLLDSREDKAIAVGQFNGPAHLPTSAGPSIAKVLSEEMQKLGIQVEVRAKLTVEGRYKDATDKKTGLLMAHLKMKVVDRNDEAIVEFDRAVFGDSTLPALFGLTVTLPPDGDDKTRAKKMEEAIDQPHAKVAGTRIGADGSPYAIEVLVRKDGDKAPAMARAVDLKSGLAFVPIQRGEVYQVRLINDSDHDAAVTLTIDGLNMFTFSDLKDEKKQPRFSVVVVPRKSAGIIRGWHRTNDHSEEFLVTEYAKSAAAELKSSANVGTITACFAAAWPRGDQPPADEPANPGPFTRSGDATGRGSRVAAKYEEVERVFGVVRATVSVRYTR